MRPGREGRRPRPSSSSSFLPWALSAGGKTVLEGHGPREGNPGFLSPLLGPRPGSSLGHRGQCWGRPRSGEPWGTLAGCLQLLKEGGSSSWVGDDDSRHPALGNSPGSFHLTRCWQRAWRWTRPPVCMGSSKGWFLSSFFF